ncbi:MAG: YidC/Oxa1 family membrane protein insertase [Oscillospiraceae bacterium]|nr:YidC/Oxa1 family membrane protein insertase [Oscillospiraceae bacterium]
MFKYLITMPMGFIIEQIYNLVANYGIAIIIFTVIIKMILIPLNIKSQKAMKKQQKIQPVIAELQQKYANDQEKLQREMMKIYKDNNISMMGGCLPMLIQFPILIGLYQVIQKPLTYLLHVNWGDLEDMANPLVTEVLRLRDGMINLGYNLGNYAQANANMIVKSAQIQLSKWAETIGASGSALEGVTGGTHPWIINFNFFGMDLSNAPSAAFSRIMALDFSQWSIIALLIIPILAITATVVSQKLMQAQSGQNKSSGNDQAAQMTKSMNFMMPVMTGFFTLTLPAGLGLYWIISSVVQIAQQLALNYYFEKKGEDVVVTIPEKKQIHGKKRKK